MFFRLTVLTATQILALVGALIYFLWRIVNALEQIGGKPDSSLAKLRMGVRAIEQESSHLAPQVTQLNAGFGALAGKLNALDSKLKSIAEALAANAGKEARS
jgi:hypothetical protein